MALKYGPVIVKENKLQKQINAFGTLFNTTLQNATRVKITPLSYTFKACPPVSCIYYNESTNKIYKKKVINIVLTTSTFRPLDILNCNDEIDDINDINNDNSNILCNHFNISDDERYDESNNEIIIQINDLNYNKFPLSGMDLYNPANWSEVPMCVTALLIKSNKNKYNIELQKILNPVLNITTILSYINLIKQSAEYVSTIENIDQQINELNLIKNIKSESNSNNTILNETCTVCLTSYINIEYSIATLLCGHSFCTDCISKINPKKCPFCQEDFSHQTKISPNITIMNCINSDPRRKIHNDLKNLYYTKKNLIEKYNYNNFVISHFKFTINDYMRIIDETNKQIDIIKSFFL